MLEREGRYLMCQRAAHKRHGGLWEFPGGKVEKGESDQAASHRELEEELGLRVLRTWPPMFESRDPGSDFVIAFCKVEAAGTPIPTEHTAIAWSTTPDLDLLPLAPSDASFVNWLRTHRG